LSICNKIQSLILRWYFREKVTVLMQKVPQNALCFVSVDVCLHWFLAFKTSVVGQSPYTIHLLLIVADIDQNTEINPQLNFEST
jgi:hypothetical protein